MQRISCNKCKHFHDGDWGEWCKHPSCFKHEPSPQNYTRGVRVNDFNKKNSQNNCPDYEPTLFTKLSTLIICLTRR